MAQESLQHVTELLDASAVDNTEWFDRLWKLTGELRARVDAKFPNLVRDPSSLPHDRYASAESGGPNGHMTTWVGEPIDWMVHSNLVNPTIGFCNMHLSMWLGPTVKVPHCAFAFGTFPDLFLLGDFPARTDTIIDTEHLYTYYEAVNAFWLKHRANENLRPFTSRALYVRETLSETAFCFLADRTDENLATYAEIANEMLDIWFAWLDAATPVPVEEQAALADRDLKVRRYAAELDPANALAVRYFGPDKVHLLERQLWGGDRQLDRIGGYTNECAPPAMRPSNY
jgi:Red chlorophyll catabolite reductase (RCC reductase)